MNKHWEVSLPTLPSSSNPGPTLSKQKFNSHDPLEQNLSIEDAFDRAMSLPSSPTVKNAEDSFDSFEEDIIKKPRSSSEKTKKDHQGRHQGASPSSTVLGRSFLDGLKIRGRAKSGDNLMRDRNDIFANTNGTSHSDDKIFPSQTNNKVSTNTK